MEHYAIIYHFKLWFWVLLWTWENVYNILLSEKKLKQAFQQCACSLEKQWNLYNIVNNGYL